MRVFMAAAEAAPFAETGGLALAIAALAEALAAAGHQVTVAVPRYRQVELSRLRPLGEPRQIRNGEVEVETRFYASVERKGAPRFVFIDAPVYFDREHFYGTPMGDYADNAARFTYFCRAALHLANALQPELLHVHDWQAALVPVLLRAEADLYPNLRKVPVLLTIHNLGYQGVFPPEVLNPLGLSWKLFTVDTLEFYGRVNFLKGGLLFADALSTVSPSYAREVQTVEFGFGLEGVLEQRGHLLKGILNGIRLEEWDPRRDQSIPQPFAPADLKGKAVAKATLRRRLGLQSGDEPLAVVVSRLSSQKGLDLILKLKAQLQGLPLQWAILGEGDDSLAGELEAWSSEQTGKVGFIRSYEHDLAHLFFAAGDMLVMPSRYEPCGLAQMQAMRYGTIPIVRAVGGLNDTVHEWDTRSRRGSGFKFIPPTAAALYTCLQQALRIWRQPGEWRQVMMNAMAQEHSWAEAARQYTELYSQVVAAGRNGSGGGVAQV